MVYQRQILGAFILYKMKQLVFATGNKVREQYL